MNPGLCTLHHQRGLAFADALLADPRVPAHLDRAAIERLLDPSAYVGLAPALVDRVVGPADGA